MLIYDLRNGLVSWQELLLPRFWRYKLADNKLKRIARYMRKSQPSENWDVLHVIVEARWRLEDEYYGKS